MGEIKRKKILLLRLTPPVYMKSQHPIGLRPPYTLKYIESLLINERAFSVRFIDQRITYLSLEDILRLIKEWLPDVLVVSVSTLELTVTVGLCKKIKESHFGKNIFIIGVGQEVAYGSKQENISKGIFDLALAGEAEIEAVSVIKDLSKDASFAEIGANRIATNPESELFQVSNLDALPFPVYDRTSLGRYRPVYPIKTRKRLTWGHILSSRGCPHECIFCSNIMRESYGKKFRSRSPKNVVDEIEYLMKAGANMIIFDDDNFTSSANHVRGICEEIIARRLRVNWVAHARVDEVNRDLLKLIRESGCVLLRYGIESGSERVIGILRKTKNYSKWIDECRSAVGETKSLGISVACLFILGSPGETQDELLQSIKLARELLPDIIQVAYFTAFPGSRAHSLFKSVYSLNSEKMYHYDVPRVNVSGMDDKELGKAQVLFYRSFLLDPYFLCRHFFKYAGFYLANPDMFLRLFRIVKHIKI
jgi:radical SAM superfamily enzyme YgiQ (UPF0313 family)